MPKYPFYTSCPSCENKNKYDWIHSSCGGSMKIWHDGDLQCESCSKMAFILEWEFNCGEHGKNRFIGPNSQLLINALASLSEVKMPMKEIFEILDKIRKRLGL